MIMADFKVLLLSQP